MIPITEYDSERKILTALLQGEIDHHCAGEIRRCIDIAIDKYSPELLALDFSGVTFMDSSGIGLVMGRYKLMKETGGETIVLNPRDDIRKLMELASLGRLTKIAYTAHSAAKASSGRKVP